ncbi:TrmH family RNA methyltransferase [Ureaplasma ceti]|uniref:RNA methyltransferase n=1 Tax=Ureaplasma ceti TaxID=3119530 RepID=A0ABP9UCQ2_9BACT
MKYKTIVSPKNELIAHAYKLINNNSYSKTNNMFVVEKYKLFEEAYKNGFKIPTIFVLESKLAEIEPKLQALKFDLRKVILISESVCNKLTDNASANYVFAICERKPQKHIAFRSGQNVLFLDNIQDPGNLGTMIRSGFALGMDLILLNNCVSLSNSKVIKASMGGCFKPNLFELDNQTEAIKALNNYKTLKYKIISMCLDKNSIPLHKFKFNKNNNVILIGNEGHGIQPELIKMSTNKIMIDMQNNMESLNAAIATAIVCYQLKFN